MKTIKHTPRYCLVPVPSRYRPYTEPRTWKAAVFSVTGVVDPTLHFLLLLFLAGDIKLNLGPTCSGCSKSIRCNTTPSSSARPACSTSTEPSYASPDRKMVFKASSVQGVLLHYCLRRPSHVTAYYHADVYSVAPTCCCVQPSRFLIIAECSKSFVCLSDSGVVLFYLA